MPTTPAPVKAEEAPAARPPAAVFKAAGTWYVRCRRCDTEAPCSTWQEALDTAVASARQHLAGDRIKKMLQAGGVTVIRLSDLLGGDRA